MSGYNVQASDANGEPINSRQTDTLAESKALARQWLTEYDDATLIEVFAEDTGDCVWDKRRPVQS